MCLQTRLASTIGSERAAQFAKASLVDLLERLSGAAEHVGYPYRLPYA